MNTFNEIDPNRSATGRQIRGIATRFSTPDFTALKAGQKPDWAQSRRITAVILQHHSNKGEPMTHGEAQALFNADVLPEVYSDLFDPDMVNKSDDDESVLMEASKPVDDAEALDAMIKALQAKKRALKPSKPKVKTATVLSGEVGVNF